jgi:N-acetylglutamate synthase-like GNAT family acetyltransferase
MIIRQTKLKDLLVISNLFIDSNLFAELKDIKTLTERDMKSFPKLNFVCEDNGRIIGAVSAVLSKKTTALINDIVVSQEYRNKQVGKKLMEALFGELKKEKIKKVELWVHWKNTRAIPFYYQFGFRMKKVDTTKNTEGAPDGEDIVHMTKSF